MATGGRAMSLRYSMVDERLHANGYSGLRRTASWEYPERQSKYRGQRGQQTYASNRSRENAPHNAILDRLGFPSQTPWL